MHTLPVGTILSRPKDGLVLHWGVVSGPNLIFHNTPERGEHESTLGEFAAGRPVTIRGHAKDLRAFQRRLSWKRLNLRPYHFLTNNCEHTLGTLIGRTPNSPQIAGWLGFAAAAAVIGLLLSD